MASEPKLLRAPRFVGLVACVVLVAGWNLFVVLNDDGIVVGRVVDADGAPVAGASVVMYEAGLLVSSPRQQTSAAADGTFRFADHGQHHFRLEASATGFGRSAPMTVRLYFRNQNTALDEPLRVSGAAVPITAIEVDSDDN